MPKEIPLVSSGRLCDPQLPGSSIQLDTPAWFAWLEAPAYHPFLYALFNRTCGH
ncbi:MAG: hypothetical protein R3A44_40285 [Caldilineaceae bacterium]